MRKGGMDLLAKRPRQIINHEMLFGTHYYRKKTVIRLLKSYYNLQSLAMWKHNYVALCIWIDLNTALYHPKVLTDRQRQCIIGVYLNGYREWEVGEMIGIGQQRVNVHLGRGIKNIQRALLVGRLFDVKQKGVYPK
jgi:DNA-binding CsgD family transcriptional regulator